jgi:hypothetical protein
MTRSPDQPILISVISVEVFAFLITAIPAIPAIHISRAARKSPRLNLST